MSNFDTETFVAKREEQPIFYQKKAPSVYCIIFSEQVEFQPGTGLILCGKLEPGLVGHPEFWKGARKKQWKSLVLDFVWHKH